MPAYNAEAYIKDAIQSVLDQSYAHLELIITNDGSRDGTLSIIHSFSDERIVLIDQENQGVSAARNAALKRMSGELFCFLDADNICRVCFQPVDESFFYGSPDSINIVWYDTHD